MLSVEKFKINNEIKTDVCRELKNLIKNDLKTNEYIEYAIMYNVEKQKFFITDTSHIQKLEFEGNCFYKLITVYKADEDKITIKSLIPQIFGI